MPVNFFTKVPSYAFHSTYALPVGSIDKKGGYIATANLRSCFYRAEFIWTSVQALTRY